MSSGAPHGDTGSTWIELTQERTLKKRDSSSSPIVIVNRVKTPHKVRLSASFKELLDQD